MEYFALGEKNAYLLVWKSLSELVWFSHKAQHFVWNNQGMFCRVARPYCTIMLTRSSFLFSLTLFPFPYLGCYSSFVFCTCFCHVLHRWLNNSFASQYCQWSLCVRVLACLVFSLLQYFTSWFFFLQTRRPFPWHARTTGVFSPVSFWIITLFLIMSLLVTEYLNMCISASLFFFLLFYAASFKFPRALLYSLPFILTQILSHNTLYPIA